MKKLPCLFLSLTFCLAAVSTRGFSSEIADWLSAFNRSEGPGISYIIVKDGQVLETKGFGLASLEDGRPMRASTPVRTGSVGKTFTALAVAIAQEQGLLNYEDSVRRHLPRLPAYFDKIQVRHLLHHSSGMPGWAKGYTKDLCPQESKSQNRITNSDVINWAAGKPESYFAVEGQQTITPGERFHYSNTGYVLLASVVESASGKSFADFLRDNVFNKAGMNAFLSSEGPVNPDRASAYSDYPFFKNMDSYRSACDTVNGDGGVYISANDFGKYMLGMQNNLFVSAETRKMMFTSGKLNDGSETGVGFAWFIDEFKGMKVVNHEGGWGGYASYIAWLPESQLWFGFSTNCIGVRRMFEDDIESLLKHLVPYL